MHLLARFHWHDFHGIGLIVRSEHKVIARHFHIFQSTAAARATAYILDSPLR